MATLIPNSFSSYDLTDKEALQGAVLTNLQKQVLQNMQAACAEEKLRLDFDIEKHLSFVQQEAYKRGQLDLLSYIISSSEIAEATLNDPNFDPNLSTNLKSNKPKED